MGRSSRCEPIRHLHDIFWDDRCKFTIHISSAAAQRKPPDWVSGPEGISVNREDVTYNMSTRLPIPEGCLTATCDLYGNGKYGGLSDIYQSTVHGARPTRNLRPPGGDHPAAQRACPSLRTRSRARSGPRMHHPGRLGERGGARCGRTGPGAANPERARSAYSQGWRGYKDTCNGHRWSPQAES